MERDEETGLSYHHARYYLPWLGSWMSADPSSIAGGLNLYAYARNNPVIHIDRNGMQSIPGPHDAGTPPPPPPPPPAHTGSGAGSGATAGATGGTAHPPAPTTPTRDITRIEVHYANSSGTGAVTITAHTASGGTITMRGMGGGARDKRGRVHTTSTRHGTVEPGGSQRDANHTSSLYPSRTPNMRFYVPFGGGEGFHMGPIGAQSHGCIHLEENDARTIFNRAQTGAQVEITVPPPPPRPPRRRATPHKTSAPAATTPKKKKN
jgi:RHS repeat-associated protein